MDADTTIERDVAAHYARGGLGPTILQALAGSGADPDRLTVADLRPVDEFHIGGHAATVELFEQIAPAAGTRWLDLGSGLGGPARHLAATYGCHVTGIDLTEDYVTLATDLARRVGLDDRVTFVHGSALALDFPDASFDGASLLHVGMNIADKAALFAGVRRVLRPGAVFAVYDVMRAGAGELAFPVPWASLAATSFLATAVEYRAALEAAGFVVAPERSRAAFAMEFFRAMQARMAADGRPALGLHLVMGEQAPQKSANMIANLERGLIAPTEMIARVPG